LFANFSSEATERMETQSDSIAQTSAIQENAITGGTIADLTVNNLH
jgi:hypothetical protein